MNPSRCRSNNKTMFTQTTVDAKRIPQVLNPFGITFRLAIATQKPILRALQFLLRRTNEIICTSEVKRTNSQRKRRQVEGYATMSVASELSIITTFLVFGFMAAVILGAL